MDTVKTTATPATSLANIALSQYQCELCRICGNPVSGHDIVFAGYSSDNSTRSAHKSCFDSTPQIELWKIH